MLQNILARFSSIITGIVVLLSALIMNAQASDPYEFWPGATYDPSIPTIQQILGYSSGDKITSHADMIRYFEALSKADPKRMKITKYAETWEGRKLIYAVIANEQNMASLPTIQSNIKKLSDPRKIDQATADRLIGQLPATVWLAYGVHGDEISSTDAAMMTAYHLLAAQNDPVVDKIMSTNVTFIDPLQNPDGRDRFIQHYRSSKGLLPDSSRLSVEQNQAWPGGRSNHYFFDMNRDWFAMSQPETRGRVKAMQEWFPLVVVDLHEMGGNQSYYFAPGAEPFNPHIPQAQRDSMVLFGKNNAKWFDKFGFDYFTREVFDYFYPGYGDGWPAYFGAVTMTYEQGSSRGLVFRRNDGNELHYRDTIRHHFVSSLATAETAALNRQKLFNNFFAYRKSAIEEGRKEKIKSYIIPKQKNQATATKLAGQLVRQGVEVTQADVDFKACGTSYSKGSYVINLAQPAKRLVRTLMDENIEMSSKFVKEQERRRTKDIPGEIYDVTAWSLPLMYNVRNDSCSKEVKNNFPKATTALFTPTTPKNLTAKVAFIAPWGQTSSARLLSHSLRRGLIVKSSDKSFTSEGRKYPAGSLIFEVMANPMNLSKTLTELAAVTGAEINGVDSSWVTDGPNFGSDNVVKIAAPRVAIAWDDPTSPYSAGNTRFVIERQLDYPVTAIRTKHLSRANLSRFQVLILPESWGSYQGTLGQSGTDNLKDWVSQGGTLIAMGSAMNYVSNPEVNLMATRLEDAFRETDAEDITPDEKTGTVKGTVISNQDDLDKAIAPDQESPDYIPGVLVRASSDADHWLAAGLSEQLNVLVSGSDIYSPLKLDQGNNVIRFHGEKDLLASGHLWEENKKQLAYKPFLMIQPRGRGHVIGFTQDPTTRAYLDGLNMSLMNAIFRGSAHSQPLR